MRKTKRRLFDNVRLAARLTELSKFPFDAQHLSIESIKFIKNDQSVQFKIEPPYDVGPPPKKRPKQKGRGKKPRKNTSFNMSWPRARPGFSSKSG